MEAFFVSCFVVLLLRLFSNRLTSKYVRFWSKDFFLFDEAKGTDVRVRQAYVTSIINWKLLFCLVACRQDKEVIHHVCIDNFNVLMMPRWRVLVQIVFRNRCAKSNIKSFLNYRKIYKKYMSLKVTKLAECSQKYTKKKNNFYTLYAPMY